jgi:hypothetical protein
MSKKKEKGGRVKNMKIFGVTVLGNQTKAPPLF